MSEIDYTYGPIVIGIFLTIFLYGVMVTQTYHYMSTFKNDKLWMKCFVAVVFIADTFSTFFDSVFLYRALVTNFGNVDAVLVADWIFDTNPTLTAFIACLVQLFFSWRIKVLTQNWAITSIIVTCSIVQLLSGIGTSIACTIVTKFVEEIKVKVIVILWLAFSTIADVLIAVTMTWHLRKKRTGFAYTDDLINRITRLTVQTGAITAVFAIIDLVAFLLSTSGLHLAFNFPLAKLYTNSLLSTLNTRTPPAPSNTTNSSSHGARAAIRKDEHNVDFIPHQFHAQSKAHEAHELGDVGLGTKVYINVEEIRESV